MIDKTAEHKLLSLMFISPGQQTSLNSFSLKFAYLRGEFPSNSTYPFSRGGGGAINKIKDRM